MDFSTPADASAVSSLKETENTYSGTVFWNFLAITLLAIALVYCMQELLINDELYYNSLAEKFTEERIQESINQAHHWAWLAFAILPVSNLIRFACVASCLSLGFFFSANKWTFKPFFWVAIQAELVLLLPLLLKIGWFSLVQPHYALVDLQNFFPLSLASVVDYAAVDVWLRYPLQVLSVFEIAYCFMLVYGVKKTLRLSNGQSVKLVTLSYGSAMTLWVAFIMFLTINAL